MGFSQDQSTVSPTQLLKKTSALLTETVDKLADLGLQMQSRFLVVAGTHVKAIAVPLVRLSDGQILKWETTCNLYGPIVLDPGSRIGLPTLGRKWTEAWRSEASQYSLPILYLPALSGNGHAADNRFVVVHELSHLTETSTSHSSPIWREGRADALASLITGLSGYEYVDGSFKSQRNLEKPTVYSRSTLLPSLQRYHSNSQIISSLLFYLARIQGPQKAIDFIKWMDAQTTDLGPSFDPRDDELNALKLYTTDAQMKLIVENVKYLAGKMRQWSTTQDSQVSAALEQLLQEREL